MILLALCNELLATEGIAIVSFDMPRFASEPAPDFTVMTPNIEEESAP
jgi:hypothetical protein